MDLYETLGVNKKANKKQIKQAYRDKAKTLHPDKGGDKDLFGLVANAYSILSDSTKKKRYDKTGTTFDKNSIRSKAMNNIQSVFHQMLEHFGIEKIIEIDVMGGIKKSIRETIVKSETARDKINKEIKAAKKVKKRIKCKNEHDLLSAVIQEKIGFAKKALTQAETTIEICVEAEKIINDYGFNYDSQEAYRVIPNILYGYEPGGGTATGGVA